MRGEPKLPTVPREGGVVTLAEVEVGAVVWAYARHYWRQVRVIAKGRTRVTVAYWIHEGGSLVRQGLSIWNLRPERPSSRHGVVSVPAPTTSECGLLEGGQ